MGHRNARLIRLAGVAVGQAVASADRPKDLRAGLELDDAGPRSVVIIALTWTFSTELPVFATGGHCRIALNQALATMTDGYGHSVGFARVSIGDAVTTADGLPHVGASVGDHPAGTEGISNVARARRHFAKLALVAGQARDSAADSPATIHAGAEHLSRLGGTGLAIASFSQAASQNAMSGEPTSPLAHGRSPAFLGDTIVQALAGSPLAFFRRVPGVQAFIKKHSRGATAAPLTLVLLGAVLRDAFLEHPLGTIAAPIDVITSLATLVQSCLGSLVAARTTGMISFSIPLRTNA